MRENSHYGGGQFKEGRMVDTEVASLMGGEWFCYKGGLFNGGRIVMLERWAVLWRQNGHVTEVGSLKEGEWSCYRGVSLMEREWSLRRWSV